MRRMQMVRISRPSLLRLWLEQQRIRTEAAIDADTTILPFSSVSALVAAAFGPAVGSAVAMSRERHAVAQLATGGSCIDARPTPVGMAAASAQIGVCRGRECGSRQPSHVISSSPHVVHAAHANGAYQQAVAAPVVA